jgi:outer membrane lipoprotein-sorting protein
VQVAFAQVVEKARQADTVAFTLQQGTEKEHKVAATGSLFRLEHASGLVVIGDGTTKKQLIIDPASKSGVVIDMSEHATVELATGLVEQLRNTRPTDAKPAGQETRDGKLADLFRVRGIKLFGIDTTGNGQGEMWVWVDRASMLPYRIELRMGASTVVTLKSMTWNGDLDPSSLAVQLPEGFSEVNPDALLKKLRPDRDTTQGMTPAEAFRKWSGQKE